MIPVETGRSRRSAADADRHRGRRPRAHRDLRRLLLPVCKDFETANATSIEALVAAGIATLEVHPIAILDRAYARLPLLVPSNNAAACVADLAPESFLDVNAAFFATQPAEGTAGLTDDEIIDRRAQRRPRRRRRRRLHRGRALRPWVTAATERATNDPT